MSQVSQMSAFVDKLEQRLRDIKQDYKIESLSPDDVFLDELLKNFNTAYDAAIEAENADDQITELKDLLRDINNLTSSY